LLSPEQRRDVIEEIADKAEDERIEQFELVEDTDAGWARARFVASLASQPWEFPIRR